MIQPSCWRKLLPFKLLSRVVFLDGICTFAVNSLIWSTLNYQVEDGTWVVFSEIIHEWYFCNKCTWNYVKKAGGLIHSMHHFGWYLHHKNTMFSRDGTWKIKFFPQFVPSLVLRRLFPIHSRKINLVEKQAIIFILIFYENGTFNGLWS